MRYSALLLLMVGITVFADNTLFAQSGTGAPNTPPVIGVDWSGIEAYVKGVKTSKILNLFDDGDKTEVKSSFEVKNPSANPVTFFYEVRNCLLYTSPSPRD